MPQYSAFLTELQKQPRSQLKSQITIPIHVRQKNKYTWYDTSEMYMLTQKQIILQSNLL